MKRLQIKILILFLAMITGNLNGMMKAPMPMFRPGINQAPLFYDPTIRAESGQEDPTAKNEAFSSKTVRRPALNAGIIASISSELAQTTESRATPENTRSAQQYQLMLLPDQQARDVIDNETIARHEQLKTQKLNKNSINIIENSNSLPSKTFIDFAQVEADHHQLAQNQLLDLLMKI